MLSGPRRILAGKVTLGLIFKAKARIMSLKPNILTWAMGLCNLIKTVSLPVKGNKKK